MQEPKLDMKAIEAAISKIKSSDFSGISIEQLEEILKPLFVGLKMAVLRYQPGFEIYRGTDLGYKPRWTSEVFLPPESKVKRMGRLNGVAEAIFYGAVARNIPFFELNRQVDDYICISKWVTTDAMVLNHIGFSKNCQDMLGSLRDLENLYPFTEMTRNFSDENKYVYDFLAFAFSKKVSEQENEYYKLTNAIGKKLLGKNGLISGILFPTIAMNGNAENIVLEKNFAIQNLKLISIEYIHIKSIEEKKYAIDIIDTACTFEKDGTIKWNGRPWQYNIDPSDKDFIVKEENGQWVFYDKNGKKREPN